MLARLGHGGTGALPRRSSSDVNGPLEFIKAKQSDAISRRGSKLIEITAFYHINDVHAHLDEFRSSGTDCVDPKQGCYGGYARVKTVIDQTRPTHNDSLFFNVGDEFQVSTVSCKD
jgi:2',3'-cyclic-nucleotide 2'-phosphodiesterase (5'-nucleotidase family)